MAKPNDAIANAKARLMLAKNLTVPINSFDLGNRMKSTQVGIAVLTKKERERREEKAKRRALEVAKAKVQALTGALAAERAANPDLAAADAEAARVVNPRVRNGGKA